MAHTRLCAQILDPADRRVLGHQDLLPGVVVDRRERHLLESSAVDGHLLGDDVDARLLDERDPLRDAQRLELDRVGVTEDRPGHLVQDVDLEALDLTAQGIEKAKLEVVLVDAGDQLAAALDRAHEAAGGHLLRGGERPAGAQAGGRVPAAGRGRRLTGGGVPRRRRVDRRQRGAQRLVGRRRAAAEAGGGGRACSQHQRSAARRAHRYSPIRCCSASSVRSASTAVSSGSGEREPVGG